MYVAEGRISLVITEGKRDVTDYAHGTGPATRHAGESWDDEDTIQNAHVRERSLQPVCLPTTTTTTTVQIFILQLTLVEDDDTFTIVVSPTSWPSTVNAVRCYTTLDITSPL